jgi:hypothetical protein
MDLLSFFLGQHAAVHAADVGGRIQLFDRIFGELSDEQLRVRPAQGLNSLVWLLWHMARTEDVAVNLVVVAGRQVLDEAWARRLSPGRRDIGTGMTEDEVADFTVRADVAAVRAYRSAVGRRTREVVGALSAATWDEPVGAADLMRANAEGGFRVDCSGLIAAGRHPWQANTRGEQLGSSAVRHNAGHVGEATTIRSLAGFPLGI